MLIIIGGTYLGRSFLNGLFNKGAPTEISKAVHGFEIGCKLVHKFCGQTFNHIVKCLCRLEHGTALLLSRKKAKCLQTCQGEIEKFLAEVESMGKGIKQAHEVCSIWIYMAVDCLSSFYWLSAYAFVVRRTYN